MRSFEIYGLSKATIILFTQFKKTLDFFDSAETLSMQHNNSIQKR